MNSFTSENGKINVNTKTQTKPVFYKQTVLAPVCESNGLKLSTKFRALTKNKDQILMGICYQFHFVELKGK